MMGFERYESDHEEEGRESPMPVDEAREEEMEGMRKRAPCGCLLNHDLPLLYYERAK
jgi:hypothetical protein